MTRLGIILALVFALSAPMAFACGCDINCPDGEQYSDAHEMCMPASDAVS